MHVAEHAKADKKQKEQCEKQLLRHYAQQNQDELRPKTMKQYGQDHRGIEHPADHEQELSDNNKNNAGTQAEKGKERSKRNIEALETQETGTQHTQNNTQRSQHQ